MPLPTNKQHVPLDQYRVNLSAIVTHPVIVAHSPKIFIVTSPPLDQIRITELDLACGHPAATRQTKISATYSEAARQVAAAHPGVTLIDLHKALMDCAIAKTPGYDCTGPALGDPDGRQRGYLEHLLPDGLHLSGEAYQIFYDIIKPHLGSEWAGSNEDDRVGYTLPDWRLAPWLDS